MNAAVPADENHVKRNVSVLHPEAELLVALEIEQHSLPLREGAAVHEAARLLIGGERQLDRESMHATLARDLKRLQLGGADPADSSSEQCEETKSGENDATTHEEISANLRK